MKWAKVKNDGSRASADQLASFEYYPDQKQLDKQFGINRKAGGGPDQVPDKTQENLWVYYKFDKYMEPERQWEYEIFCGGFLQFYDIEVRNKATNHQLYFEWSPFKRKGPFYVAIYLFPKPVKKKDLKKLWPTAGGSAKSGELQKAVAESSVKATATDSDTQEDVNDSIDPPTPPPPPPPPRE